MNKEHLKNLVLEFARDSKRDPFFYQEDMDERKRLIKYYQGFTKQKIMSMTDDTIYEYISQLWAMRIWGNKLYVVEKIIADNEIENFKDHLAELIWGTKNIESRWDKFRKSIKGMGPAMISELLCKTHPNKYMLWNRRAYVGLNYLGVKDLPRYDYQLSGLVYTRLCSECKTIAKELEIAGMVDNSLLAVDYFIWHKLQVEDNLNKIHISNQEVAELTKDPEASEFIHNDVRDKLRDIGQMLGFNSEIERRVSDGSKVDTIWQSTIGNMGRVIYVFEVQTKGSIDSLILNLLKSLNNPAVQGVVAVSDTKQLEKIKDYVKDVKELRDKLKYWNYEEVLQVHESLEYTNSCINALNLVPEGFNQ